MPLVHSTVVGEQEQGGILDMSYPLLAIHYETIGYPLLVFDAIQPLSGSERLGRQRQVGR